MCDRSRCDQQRADRRQDRERDRFSDGQPAVTGRLALGGGGYRCSVDRCFLGAASPIATTVPPRRAWALADRVAKGIGAGGTAVSAVPWGPASRPSIHGHVSPAGRMVTSRCVLATCVRATRHPDSLPGNADRQCPAGEWRKAAERVAVEIDDAAASASTPVDQRHVHAAAGAAHGHRAATPASDSQRRSGRRVEAARVGVVTGADSCLAVPACLSTNRVAAATAPARAGKRLRLGGRLEHRFRADGLIRVRTGLERAVLLLEVPDLGNGRRRTVVDGRQWRGVAGLGTGDFYRQECGGVQAGGWGSGTSDRGRGDGQRRDRGQDGKRNRSSNGQTVTPATALPSGRDWRVMDMPGRFAATGWQETLYCSKAALQGGFRSPSAVPSAMPPNRATARIMRACDPGRGRAGRRRLPRLARGDPRPSTPPRAPCPLLRSAVGSRRARWPA